MLKLHGADIGIHKNDDGSVCIQINPTHRHNHNLLSINIPKIYAEETITNYKENTCIVTLFPDKYGGIFFSFGDGRSGGI